MSLEKRLFGIQEVKDKGSRVLRLGEAATS